jgi:clan AA aspartic protease
MGVVGKVMTKVRILRPDDHVAVDTGRLRLDEVPSLEIDMLVDTGAVMPALPEEIVEALDLPRQPRKRPVRMADGTVRELEICDLGMVILGREFLGNALILPRGTTPLLGQVPLEVLDLVVVPGTGEVTTNPAHGGQWVVDLLSVA